MRPIKIRCVAEDGENVYVNFSKMISGDLKNICQLVGYDADGNEVYEGDVIQTPDSKCYLIEDLNLGQKDFIAACKLKGK